MDDLSMNNIRSSLALLQRSAILRCAAVLLAFLGFAGCASVAPHEDPIFFATVTGNSAKAAALLKEKPDLVFIKGKNGATPLHLAAALPGGEKVAEVLLANKADVNARNDAGNTPLHVSEISGNPNMAELLLAKGADINARNNTGATPLHMAAAVGHKEMVESLLGKGANVNARDNAGETPLRWAEKSGKKDMVELLRRRGGHA